MPICFYQSDPLHETMLVNGIARDVVSPALSRLSRSLVSSALVCNNTFLYVDV